MAKNHYVSQLIIKRFAPSVTTFDVNEKRLIENRQAHKIFYKKDIYDNPIEEKLAHDLEQPFARLLDEKILHAEKIVLLRKELFLLKQFLLLDSVRTYDAESFVQVMRNFQRNVERYLNVLDVSVDRFAEKIKSMPSIFDFHLEPRAIQMRAMRLFLDCQSVKDLLIHPLTTKELYCWALVNYESYVTFWDSNDEQEFVLTSTGMVSEYEPSHDIFKGLDLSKFAYLLNKLGNDKRHGAGCFYARCLSITQIMYENFNIFNLSSSRCMVLIHPFFRLFDGRLNFMNGERIELDKPDVWPSCFETKEIVLPPTNRYKLGFIYDEEDEYEYIPKKLTLWDTIYLNSLILGQTHELIGFNDVRKIVDSLSFVNLLGSLEDKELLYKLSGISALERWVNNIVNDKYFYIFKHYKDLNLKCKLNTVELLDKLAFLKWRDIRENRYLLKYLLSKEEQLRTMPNFRFMGTPDQVVEGIKKMLEKLKENV